MKKSARALLAALLCLVPALLTAEPGRHRKTWRALLEEGVLFAASSADYWSRYNRFTIDWQFTWRTFGRKFFTAESPRLDSNAFWFNWSHAGAGGGYYSMARANGLDSRVSTLFSFATSALWESVTEWREIISVNDLAFTSFGGPAIGEPLFQIGSYFSRRPGLLNRAAAFIFNPFLAANDWFDRGNGPAWMSGAVPGWHRFRLSAALRTDKVSPAGTTAVARSGIWGRQSNLALDMETVTAPGRAEGTIAARFYPDTLSSRILIETTWGASRFEEIDIRTHAVLFGIGWQAVRDGSDGEARGSGGSLGFGTAFELFKKGSVAWYDGRNEIEGGGLAPEGDGRLDRPVPTRFTDKLSAISPVGAVLRLIRFGPRFNVRWTASAFGDFAMVNALAYNRFTESRSPAGVKTTLLNWGYYYALGMTLASEAAAEWRSWHVEAGTRYQWYDSIQGLDRYQYQGLVTDDFKLRDTRLVWRLNVGYRLPRTPLELGLAAEGSRRAGRLPGFREAYREKWAALEIGLLF